MDPINRIRFGGIASGLDTESIVKQLMRLERNKVDTHIQQKTLLEWKRDDYRSINTKLLSLRNSTFDLRLQSTFMTRKVASSDEKVLTATAGAGTVEGNYSVKVNQLAAGVHLHSNAPLGSNADKTNLAAQFGETLADEVSFTLKGQNGEKTFTFTTRGEDAHSIYDVVRDINNSGIGIKASYDATLDRFFLMTAGTGTEAIISVENDDNNFLSQNLKIDYSTEPLKGTNASIDYNGLTGIEYQSNSFTLNGMVFELKAEGEAKVTVSHDIDSAVDKIKDWVEKYNTIMEDINTKLSEKRYRQFPPLTEEQKDALSEKDIEKWEEKARSGIFRADSLLSGTVSNIRMTTMSAVTGLEGDYKTLSSLGINTSAWYDQGKLYIDEDKLRKALTEDPEGVIKLFSQEEEVDQNGKVIKGNGIARSLYDTINTSINTIREKAGTATTSSDQSLMGKEITDADKRIAAMEERLISLEESYWRKFTAMETALQKMQSQSDWLTSQLSGLQSK